MSIFQETRVVGQLGAEAAEALAPAAVSASKTLVEEAFSHILRKPLTLKEALPKVNEIAGTRGTGEVSDYFTEIAQSLHRAGALKGLKVTRVLGLGADDLVFATESNTALKLGVTPLPRPIHEKLFDAPVLEHGQFEYGVRYYMQPIGETKGVTQNHAFAVMNKVRRAGYIEDDMWETEGARKDQIALFGSRRMPLLIDQGGAVAPYGKIYENGQLVTHPGQQSNLAEMREYLAQNNLKLRGPSAKPINPYDMGQHSFSSRISDDELVYSLQQHMDIVSNNPTLAKRWTSHEVTFGLRSLMLEK